jgi:hypothetical protein
VRGVPDDLFAMGYGTLLDFAGAMETTADGVLLVCRGPSAAELDVTDHEAVRGAVLELAPFGAGSLVILDTVAEAR